MANLSASPTAVQYDAKYYAEMGNNYSERAEFRIAALWRAAYIMLALKPRTILDVGGGMGLLVERLQTWGKQAYGLELSHYAITQAPDAVRRGFCQGSALSLPFADSSFDVVASVNVMEHLKPEEVPVALREFARVARRGLYQEITVLEDASVIHRDPTHHTKLKAKEWLHLLRRELAGWRAQRGLHIPYYKNGIFILNR